MMTRLLMLLLLLSIVGATIADRAFIRTLTAKKSAVAVSVKTAETKPLSIETQEVVNTESVITFSEDALVRLFNYRPGKAREHMEQDDIRVLFINDESYEKFKKQFITWSNYEFNVNNISIKEAIVDRGYLVKSPSAPSGRRIWRYSGYLPVLDRGVGDTSLSLLKVKISMVYLGPEGGLGVFSIKLSL